MSGGHDLSGMHAALAALLRTPLATPEHEFTRTAIDLAEELTGSVIGYFHYVNDDQDTIELGTWSTRTIAQCAVVNDRHYPVSSAGIWADTFRRRRAVVHNDYAADAAGRGLPEGHVLLTRHLGVAVVDPRDQVRLLVGVGNKVAPYDEDDVVAVQAVADDAWLVIARLREHQEQRRHLRTLAEHSGLSPRGVWEWDPDTREASFSPGARRLIARIVGDDGPDGWRALVGQVPPRSAADLRSAIATTAPGSEFVLETHVASLDARTTRLRITGHWLPRARGDGMVMHGTLDDVSLLDTVEESAFRATHDPLTGLRNRSALVEELTRRMDSARRGDDEFAVLFVDLDGFKEVNDRYGHLTGDRVLEQTARRLRAATREGDLVARFGGDEFVVVQTGGPPREAIDGLGARIVAVLAEPLVVDGHEIRLGASVGVSRSTDSLPGIDALLTGADRALYAAKARGGGTVVHAPVPRPPDPG